MQVEIKGVTIFNVLSYNSTRRRGGGHRFFCDNQQEGILDNLEEKIFKIIEK